MRKVLFAVALVAIVAGCNNNGQKTDRGGENAIQFVRERVPELRQDIASMEVVAVDSLLSDVALSFASIRASEVKTAYYQGLTSYAEMDRVLDSCQAELMAVEHSWKYGTVSKKVEKYKYQWRKVYTVRVTMKSGDTKEPRVLMDNDGVTPRRLESEFMLDLLQYRSAFAH